MTTADSPTIADTAPPFHKDPERAAFLRQCFCGDRGDFDLRCEIEQQRFAQYCLHTYGETVGRTLLANRLGRPHGDRLLEAATQAIQPGLTFIAGRPALIPADPERFLTQHPTRPALRRLPSAQNARCGYIALSDLPTPPRDFHELFAAVKTLEPDFSVDELFWAALARLDRITNDIIAERLHRPEDPETQPRWRPSVAARALTKLERTIADDGAARPPHAQMRNHAVGRLAHDALFNIKFLEIRNPRFTAAAFNFILGETSLANFKTTVAALVENNLRRRRTCNDPTPRMLPPRSKDGDAAAVRMKTHLWRHHLRAAGFQDQLAMRFGDAETIRCVIIVQKSELRPSVAIDLAKEILHDTSLEGVLIGDVAVLPEAVARAEARQAELHFVIRGENADFGENFVRHLLAVYGRRLPAYIRLVERRAAGKDEAAPQTDAVRQALEAQLADQLHAGRETAGCRETPPMTNLNDETIHTGDLVADAILEVLWDDMTEQDHLTAEDVRGAFGMLRTICAEEPERFDCAAYVLRYVCEHKRPSGEKLEAAFKFLQDAAQHHPNAVCRIWLKSACVTARSETEAAEEERPWNNENFRR